MNTSGHEESIKNMILCVELCPLFSCSWSAHQQHEDGVLGGGAGTWVVHPILSPDYVIEINEH